MERLRAVASNVPRRPAITMEEREYVQPLDPPLTWRDYALDIGGFVILAIALLAMVVGVMLV